MNDVKERPASISISCLQVVQDYSTVYMYVSLLGLAEFAARKYKSAAKNFLQASFDNCECPEVSGKQHGEIKNYVYGKRQKN